MQTSERAEDAENATQAARRCWICYADETPLELSAGLKARRWCSPCKCRGSLGHAHEQCVLRFIDSRSPGPFSYSLARDLFDQVGNEDGAHLAAHNLLKCPQCHTPYRVLCPLSATLNVLGLIGSAVNAATPYLLFTGATLAVLFLSTAYGAYVVYTVAGSEGEQWMTSSAWGFRLWTSLPLIPLALIGARTSLLENVLPLLPLVAADFNFTFSLHPLVSNDPHLVLPIGLRGRYGRIGIHRLQLRNMWPPSASTMLLMLPIVRHSYNRMLEQLYQIVFPRAHIALNTTTTTGDSSPVTNIQTQRNQNIEDDDNDEDLRDDERALLSLEQRPGRNLGSLVVGALIFPAIAATSGVILTEFIPIIPKYFPTRFLQSILGGCVFVVTKDALALYYVLQRRKLWTQRKVLNYDDVITSVN